MQQACYWSDTAMADKLFSRGETFQADHIISLANNTGIWNKVLKYNLASATIQMDYLKEGAKTAISHFYYHAILTWDVSDNLPQIIEMGRYAEQQVKLPSQVLQDQAYQPFIDRYKSLWANAGNVSFAELQSFTMMGSIHLEDVAYFTEAMWNGWCPYIH